MEEAEGFGSWSFWDTSLWKQGHTASLGQQLNRFAKIMEKRRLEDTPRDDLVSSSASAASI